MEEPATEDITDELPSANRVEKDPTLPGGVSDPLRRRFLKALGASSAAAATVSLAGCTQLLTTPPDDPEEIDYADIDRFTPDWIPKQIVKPMNVQVAFNSERVFFRFNWEQPDPGGWIHDMIVYQDGEWQRFIGPSPWVPADPDPEQHQGFYEDRLSFFLDDGSVKGFENFGGWMTVHMGVRTLPGAATAGEVEAHEILGDEGYGRNDVRKYLPQSRGGEWWEHSWEDIEYTDEEMLDQGVFLDLPMWRAHRSAPVGLCSDHHVTDYRHGDEGTNAHESQGWDPETGPELMWDPDIVEGGALDLNEIMDGNIPDQQEDVYHLELGVNDAEFDPDVAEWEGAMIPRRPLNPREETEGSAVDWKAPTSVWDDGEWTVVMARELQTDYPHDTKQLEPGAVYDWAPALHHGIGQRWHWVAYPYKLGLGQGTAADIRATQFSGDEPDWETVPTDTLPLIYPGQADWTWLTSKQHRGHHLVRTNQMSIWDIHDSPERMAALLLGLELDEAPRR